MNGSYVPEEWFKALWFPERAVIHKMHTGGVRLKDLQEFRDRLKVGTSECPPYVLWPEFHDAVDATLKSPDMGIYGSISDITPEELEVAIDELIDEKRKKR